MFHYMCCGTLEQDAEILNFTSKLAPGGDGYDDDELQSVRGGSVWTNRKAEKQLLAESQSRMKSIDAMVDSISTIARSFAVPQQTSSSTVSVDDSDAQYKIEAMLLEERLVLIKQRAQWMELDAKNETNVMYLDLLGRRINKLRQKLFTLNC